MENKKYHFIAIGGIGMSGLAKYLLENGCEVSGSDIEDSSYVDRLRKLGAKVYYQSGDIEIEFSNEEEND